MDDIHGSWELLQERRRHLTELRKAEAALFNTGYGAMSRQVGDEADELEATVFWLPTRCLVAASQGQPHTFESSTLVGALNEAEHGPGICGPCSAAIDAMVAKMHADGLVQ